MSQIYQMCRELTERPAVVGPAGVSLRHFGDAGDVELWLELRRRAFARERFGVRDWTAAEFGREFLEKAWWRPERLWFAVPELPSTGGPQVLGTVALARRSGAAGDKPVLHWLAVLPAWRRRGVARLLVSAAEAACWDAGEHEIWLETHTAWQAAVKFYEALGYRRRE